MPQIKDITFILNFISTICIDREILEFLATVNQLDSLIFFTSAVFCNLTMCTICLITVL